MAPGPAVLSHWCPWHPCRRRHAPRTSYPTQHRKSSRRWRRRRVGDCWWRVSTLSSSSSSSSSSEDEGIHCYRYYSDTETNMPGGFENSAMKSSFSLSSLQPSSASLETPEHARLERPYNSLRKTCRRDPEPEQELWRRSWDRREDTKDEFWNALKPNYLYLMDSNLIDSCKEAGRDLNCGASPSHDWNFEQFCTQFTQLDCWLTSIQETIYSKEENVTDRNLRLTHVEEMHRKTNKRKIFNNQGGRLAAKHPELREDIKWRTAHLNRKWERLEQTVTPRKRTQHDHLTHAIDVEHELNCLRKWLRLTERRLLPLDLHASWGLSELEVKAKEHQVIQREVELHGKIVCSVLKRCDRLQQVEVTVGSPVNLPARGRRLDSQQALKTAKDLERRWQHLYIRSLEWICHIENQTKQAKTRRPVGVSCVESDEGEPVLKHPRLSVSPCPQLPHLPHRHSQDADDDCLMEVSPSSLEEMVGPQNELPRPLPPPHSPDTEDVLNKNYSFHKTQFETNCQNRQSTPLETARRLFTDENATFTKSARPAANRGTFYFKHRDTDDGNSDSDQVDGAMETDSKQPPGNSSESSASEEEWTYKCGEDSPAQNEVSSLCQSTETLSSVPKSVKEILPRHKLQELIDKAEEMASPKHGSPARKPRSLPPFDKPKAKLKVRDWMMRRDWHPEDEVSQMEGESCDASWECTSEEERQSSGDFNNCELPCHQSTETIPMLNSPTSSDKPSPLSELASTPDQFKISAVPAVVLRTRRKEGTPKRPLSESGLGITVLPSTDDKLNQSRSESALNQMDHTPTQSVKMDTSVQGTLSSSTTVEEITFLTQEGSGGGYSSNSMRKRKSKLRKRNQGRKSDSGSDGRDPPSPHRTVPVSRRIASSGTETEEDLDTAHHKSSAKPKFKIGPEGGPVTRFLSPCSEKALSADSSWSEQAWDPFQEKYTSEAYSEELADHRQLLECDDYRNYLDSDGASSLGFKPGNTIQWRRRQLGTGRESSGVDSDSEGQEIRNFIARSLSQLTYSEQVWNHLFDANAHLVMAKDFAEIKSTCEENIKLLKDGLELYEKANEFSKEYQEIRGLKERWESLELRSEELQKMRSLQREMAGLREELLDLTKRVNSVEHYELQDRDQLDVKIRQIKSEQVNLRERKTRLVEVNTAVHKFFTDSWQQDRGQEAAARLKEDVKDLYFVWEETNKRVSHQLDSLSQLSAAWQAFESHLTELQLALRSDHKTLCMLDSALQEGPVSQDVVTSVSDVAKVLSEKQDLCFQSVCALNNTTSVILSQPPGSTEGSLSDSGISDSGSEQESEREKRLSALRRLARQLEAVLSPNHQAILDMARRIEQTEEELRGLQKTCRELIGRTAVCAEARLHSPPTSPFNPPTTLVNRSKKQQVSGPQSFMELGNPDDDPDPGKGPAGWLWRVIRAALPFQMAILAIFCVACLLEPHCCDSMNNLNFSLTPQLRYMQGPPPI